MSSSLMVTVTDCVPSSVAPAALETAVISTVAVSSFSSTLSRSGVKEVVPVVSPAEMVIVPTV